MDEESFKVSQSTEDWIVSTAAKRAELREWAASGKSQDPGLAMEMEHQAAVMLNEAEEHLAFERCRSMWFARKHYGELTSRERDLVEKSAIRQIQSVVNDCAISKETSRSRYFSTQKMK